MQGMRPIVEMQFADFSSIALNQILNNAGTHYWRTGVPVPITVRLPSGGTKGSGPFHSQSMEVALRALSRSHRNDAGHGGGRLHDVDRSCGNR
jgi:pyruvate/2-oxoglutarate/acetoin dehydrogenase E1 component